MFGTPRFPNETDFDSSIKSMVLPIKFQIKFQLDNQEVHTFQTFLTSRDLLPQTLCEGEVVPPEGEVIPPPLFDPPPPPPPPPRRRRLDRTATTQLQRRDTTSDSELGDYGSRYFRAKGSRAGSPRIFLTNQSV